MLKQKKIWWAALIFVAVGVRLWTYYANEKMFADRRDLPPAERARLAANYEERMRNNKQVKAPSPNQDGSSPDSGNKRILFTTFENGMVMRFQLNPQLSNGDGERVANELKSGCLANRTSEPTVTCPKFLFTLPEILNMAGSCSKAFPVMLEANTQVRRLSPPAPPYQLSYESDKQLVVGLSQSRALPYVAEFLDFLWNDCGGDQTAPTDNPLKIKNVYFLTRGAQ